MNTPPLILIVDDEEDFREILSDKLGSSGFQTATAENGQDGIKQAENLMPDLILMDIFMPSGIDGTDAALAIKQNPKTKDIKIAFLSNINDPWPRVRGGKERIAKDLGMEDYLEKSRDLDLLVDKVKSILRTK